MAHENIIVWHYDAFSEQAGKGNPAGVVPDADHISESDMLRIAHAVGFNETVFICQSRVADYRFRFFTPGHEMNLCGHGTIAGIYHLKNMAEPMEKSVIRIETKAGIIEVQVHTRDGKSCIVMEQARPKFISYDGDIGSLAESMGIQVSDIDSDFPIIYGSTGTWTLLVPIKGLEPFSRMKPKNHMFPQVLTQNPRSSVHPFCMSALSPRCDIHARHFSSPFSGTVEDPVTGTASGAIGAYYATYIERDCAKYSFTIEQGQEIGREGEVNVAVLRTEHGLRVTISGTAVYVAKQVTSCRQIESEENSRL